MIIGLDLAGSKKGKTGFALLDDSLGTRTKVLRTDKEIIDETMMQEGLITIDAPLGLPKGRCCLDYNCKCVRYGYSREAEKELRKMGIRVFPCGFAGMRQLTMRGIKLKKYFERKGREVIETYPGSAQDILGIPRKGKDCRKLQRALIKYGFKGEVKKKEITDHELDAITSAFVGKLHNQGKTIALGIKKESQIITARPKTNKK
jgi:hypothetical protein